MYTFQLDIQKYWSGLIVIDVILYSLKWPTVIYIKSAMQLEVFWTAEVTAEFNSKGSNILITTKRHLSAMAASRFPQISLDEIERKREALTPLKYKGLHVFLFSSKLFNLKKKKRFTIQINVERLTASEL